MILLFNCRITVDARGHLTQNRGILGSDSHLDIFLYTLASFSCLQHIFNQIIVLVECSDQYSGQDYRIRDLLDREFKSSHVYYRPKRCSTAQEFRQLDSILGSEEVIWFHGNHDHPFIDWSSDIAESIESTLISDPDPWATVHYSHWPETLTRFNGQERQGHFLLARTNSNTSVKVVKRAQWEWYWHQHGRDGYRFDHYDALGLYPPQSRAYVPMRELCRHYDSYSHAYISIEQFPPLVIPQGFFSGEIKVGSDVRISSRLRHVSLEAQGAHWRGDPKWMPLAWRTRAGEFDLDQEPGLQMDIWRSQLETRVQHTTDNSRLVPVIMEYLRGR